MNLSFNNVGSVDVSTNNKKVIDVEIYDIDVGDIAEEVLDEIGESQVVSHFGNGLLDEFDAQEIADYGICDGIIENNYTAGDIIDLVGEESLLNEIGWDTIKDHFKDELKLELLGL